MYVCAYVHGHAVFACVSLGSIAKYVVAASRGHGLHSQLCYFVVVFLFQLLQSTLL